MIAVIADDLTGAAEIAGLGWRHGPSAEILERNESPGDADLVVYDSDSRNCSATEAARRVRGIIRRLQRRPPVWFFKKVDSVLRGNVLAEIEASLKALHWTRCVLVPANPSAGRVIRGGNYFVQGKPIHRTDFRNDPHHPRLTAQVAKLLGAPRVFQLAIGGPEATGLTEGITLGEATSCSEVRRWSCLVDAGALPAGGADFFRALLLERGLKPRTGDKKFNAPANSRTLFVTGSLAGESAGFLRRSRSKGWPILLMPDELLYAEQRAAVYQTDWARRIVEALNEHPKVVVAIGRPTVPGKRAPLRLGRALTGTVAKVLSATQPDRVCVEGGATAAMLMRRMGWTRLTVEREFSTGVTAVRPQSGGELSLVLKPGSYPWPPAVRG